MILLVGLGLAKIVLEVDMLHPQVPAGLGWTGMAVQYMMDLLDIVEILVLVVAAVIHIKHMLAVVVEQAVMMVMVPVEIIQVKVDLEQPMGDLLVQLADQEVAAVLDLHPFMAPAVVAV